MSQGAAEAESTPRWTDAQLTAIRTIDRNLLVSAAAGSGKTAVLAERCVHLVCEAANRCDVDRLLVVTFTRAAAAEMRGRIERALLARSKDRQRPTGESDRLYRQLRILDRAEIGTLHAFCAKLIRRHFNLLGIDPAFITLDEHEAQLLRRETFDRLIEQRLEADGNGALQRFIDAYAGSNETQLRALVLRTFDLARSTVDPRQWMDDAVARLDEAARAKNLVDSKLGRSLLEEITRHIDGLQGNAARLLRRVAAEFAGYTDLAQTLHDQLVDYRAAAKARDMPRLANLLQAACEGKERAPTFKNLSEAQKEAKERIKAAIDELRDEVQSDKSWLAQVCRFTDDEWRAGSRDCAAAAGILRSLVADFQQAYAESKQRLRALDFGDLERLTLDVLRDPASPPGQPRPSPAAREYQDQFLHVLVDEYQDINALQDAILRLLSHESSESDGLAPNLFCVGDVKQSIYRFRLADPRRFLERAALFADESSGGKNTLIPLSDNFRSDPEVIDAINAVFERLMTRTTAEIEYDRSHRLRAGKPPHKYVALASDESAVELHLVAAPSRGGNGPAPTGDDDELDRTEREAAVVAQQIRRLIDGPDKFRHGHIAILLRAMKHKAQQFAGILRRFGIPVHADAGSGFFEAIEVQDILSLLRVLDNPLQDIPLASLLRSPLCRIDNADDKFARLRLRYSGDNSRPFHRAVFAAAGDGAADEVNVELRRFRNDLERWRTAAAERPIAGVLWEIMHETGFLAFNSALRDGRQRLANLLHLYDLAREFGTFQKQGLRRFLEFLSSLEEESDLGQPNVVSDPGDVVRVMSVHRSKGLQFPVVIVPDLGKKLNFSDLTGAMLIDRDLGIAPQVVDLDRRVRYPSLASTVTKARLRSKLLAEELRVLYVAMTRAQRKLILLGTTDRFDALDEWREPWANHIDPLPPEVLWDSATVLDWVVPAHAAIESHQPGLIDVFEHDPAAVRQAEEAAQQSIQGPKIDRNVLALRPLPGFAAPPDATREAGEVLTEMSWQHPMGRFARVPAARAVTQLTKSGRRAGGGKSVSEREIVPFTRPLPPPAFTTPGRVATPTERGVATHRLLQTMRLSTQPTVAAVEAEIQRLLDRKTLATEEARAVDVAAVAWFLATPLGDALRQHAPQVYRELPLFVPAPAMAPTDEPPLPESTDPLDRMMLRGQIDVLIRVPEGLVIVDYKTDRVTAETLAARVDFYRPQVHAYCAAMTRITGLPVIGAHLAFLAVRQVVGIEPAGVP